MDAKAALVGAVKYLPPGETTMIEIDVSEGTVVGACPQGKAAIVVQIAGATVSTVQIVPVQYGDRVSTHAVSEMAPGKLVFKIENHTTEQGMFVIAVLPPGFDLSGLPVHFVPFLNGKRLLTTQAFRDPFRSEVIRAREGIGVKDITLLFTDLKGSTALYDRIGDLNAFGLVQQHFDLLQDVITRREGAIIKTIGDAVMATFLQPSDAVAAALAMRKEIATFNAHQPDRALIRKIGIHKGAAIAVTLNERLDYFDRPSTLRHGSSNLLTQVRFHFGRCPLGRKRATATWFGAGAIKHLQAQRRAAGSPRLCIPKEPANRGEVEVTS